MTTSTPDVSTPPPGHDIAVIAHRAGGDLDAENSTEGLIAAAEAGAKWAEIDIQRTKDGHYVINHDGTFARVAGVDKASSEMTLDEVKDLEIQNLFTPGAPARPVPTIEALMDAAKGRIGIFIELKGATADTKMVDDMAALIKARKIEDSMALLSLDYDLINYAETTYPELTTGYLYYFAVGDMTKLNADYLIMEEGVASPSTVDTLHQAGKKVVVWTVNSPESIDQFAGSQVDGIITDKPREVYAGIQAKRERDDIDRVIDTIFSE